jgi:hypothetical protein
MKDGRIAAGKTPPLDTGSARPTQRQIGAMPISNSTNGFVGLVAIEMIDELINHF